MRCAILLRAASNTKVGSETTFISKVAPSSPLASKSSPTPMRLAGLEPLLIGDDSLFVNIGERTNVTGSKAFARLILSGDFAGAVEVARSQVQNGAQMIDVSMDEGMLESKASMTPFHTSLDTQPAI